MRKYKIDFNKILIFGFLLLGILVICLPFITHADNGQTTSTVTDDLLNQLFDTDMSKGIGAVIGLSSDGSAFGEVGRSIADSVFKVMSVIAMIYTAGMVIYGIVKDMAFGDGTLKVALKASLKLIVAIVLIMYSGQIMDILDDIGNKFIHLLDNQAFTTMSASTMQESLSSTGFVMVVIFLYIRIVSYGLIIELAIRRILMPLAIGSITLDGIRSSGFKFVKKYIAVYFKILIMVIIFGVALTLAWNGQNILAAFCILCSACGFMGKAARFADEVLGT